MANYTKIGRIRPDYTDAWDPARSYTALEIALSADGRIAYIAKKDVPAGTPLTDTAYWGPVLDVTGLIADTEAAADRANAAAEQADAARAGIEDALNARAPAIVCTGEGETITLTDSSDDPLKNLRIFGRTDQNGTPMPDAPVPLVNVGDKGSIGVSVAGKNLFDKNAVSIGFINDTNGEYYAEDPGCRASDWMLVMGDFITITNTNMSDYMWGAFYDADKQFVSGIAGYYRVAVHEIPEGARYVRLTVLPEALETFQVELGSVATAYEPYKGGGLALSTPNGLPGIPVTSGGNYTDAAGQRWICDEIDLARGVYVQRVGTVDLGALDWLYTTSGATRFSSSGIAALVKRTETNDIAGLRCPIYTAGSAAQVYTGERSVAIDEHQIWICDPRFSDAEVFRAEMEGVMLLYALAVPVETPLPAETIAAYRALHTHKPNTTVMNDAGAHMAVDYNADTRTYIDNKFAALAAAIVNN